MKVVKPQNRLDRKLHGTPEQKAEKARLEKYNEKVPEYSGMYYDGYPGIAVIDKEPIDIGLNDSLTI